MAVVLADVGQMHTQTIGEPMQSRINEAKIPPEAAKAMWELENYVRNCGLEPSLLELVKFRASQINGCAYCIDMHTKDARLEGETEQRLYLLNAWREATIYSAPERAALAWAEAVTKLENGYVPDEVYAQAREHFDEHQLMKLTLAVVGINGWNRFNIAFNNPPGTYQAGSMSLSRMAGRQG
jgi:AhpD family alkylhydroperoxidase